MVAMMPRLTLKMGPLFFDSRKLIAAMDRAKRKVMSSQGAFVRRKAKTSLKSRRKASAPGQPPRVHGRDSHLRRLIFFVYDPIEEDVIIGPEAISRKRGFTSNEFGKTTPQRLEGGGPVILNEVFLRKDGWIKVDGQFARRWEGRKRSRRTTVAARPFMNPALIRGMQEWVKKWEGALV